MNQQSAIEIWTEKLDHLRIQQAKGDDSFKTKKDIEEAEAQIAKLTAAPENNTTPRPEKAEIPAGYLDWLKRQCVDIDVFGLKAQGRSRAGGYRVADPRRNRRSAHGTRRRARLPLPAFDVAYRN